MAAGSTRQIPEARIKTLTASCTMHGDFRGDADDCARSQLAKIVAAELVAKLFEFSKVAKHEDGEVLVYSVELDVIVPPTPSAMPSSEAQKSDDGRAVSSPPRWRIIPE